MELTPDQCWRALRTRDPRFDGRFFTAVRSTGIYCRPICPARTPKQENCLFLPSAAAAQSLGFRPCLRCRPEASPVLAAWRGTANTVTRALRLIEAGALDGAEEGADIDSLAARLGVGGRHLRRLFAEHLGASPVAVAQVRRLLFAKTLLTETRLPMTDVALAAGFGSLRRFNDTISRTYGRPPSSLRRERIARIQGKTMSEAPKSHAVEGQAGEGRSVRIKLPFQPPYDRTTLFAMLRARLIPGIEAVEGDSYRRSFRIDRAHGVFEVRPDLDANRLVAEIRCPTVSALAGTVTQIRRQFDLDADVIAIEAQLSADPLMAPLVAARPGLRMLRAWDPFELAVRAVLGQQITVAAATVLAGRVAATYGTQLLLDDGLPAPTGLSLVFPTPDALLDADPGRLRIPSARAATLRALARAVLDDPALLSGALPLEETLARLVALPGIGPWTAQYIAMRGLGEPDAFPDTDLVVRKAAVAAGIGDGRRLLARADAWRPWRSYAVLHLWMSLANSKGG